MYLLTYHQQTNWSQETNEQTKVVQEVVSPEVSKLNHALVNKKQGDQMQFSLEKPSYQSMDCVIKWGNRLSNSIRIFAEKTAEMS